MTKPNPGWREYERTTEGVVKAEVLKIKIDLIYIEDGFNVRDLNKPKTQEKIQAIKEAYKAGRYVQPIEVALKQGQATVVDGHCRLTAAKLANDELRAEGNPLVENLLCVPFKGNDIERLTHMVTGNSGENLTPLEVSDVVKRLTNQGLTSNDIAKYLSCSASWVGRLLTLSNAPHAVKVMLKEEKVSTEAVLDLLQKHGDETTTVLQNMLEKVGGKVTPKHTRAQPLSKQVFPVVQALLDELPPFAKTKAEDYTVTLSGAAINLIVDIQNLLDDKESKCVL